jgi:hypothetical protein
MNGIEIPEQTVEEVMADADKIRKLRFESALPV